MTRDIEIQGGAGEFEAAVIAVVVDMIEREETERRSHPESGDRSLPDGYEQYDPQSCPSPKFLEGFPDVDVSQHV